MTNNILGGNPERAQPRNKKVFDIVRPGKSLAPANSRSVPISIKPPVSDDQFVEKTPSAPPVAQVVKKEQKATVRAATDLHSRRPLMSARHKVSIAPPAGNDSGSSAVMPSAPPLETPPAPKKVVVQPPRSTISVASDDEPEAVAVGKRKSAPTPAPVAEPLPPSAPALAGGPKPQLVTSVPMAAPAPRPAAEPEEVTQVAVSPAVRDAVPEKFDPLLQPPTDDAIPDIMSQDDLMSQTAAPGVEDRRGYVSHHRSHMRWWGWVLVLLAIVGLALVAFNFLLDAEVVTTELDLPYTNFLN